VQIKKRGVDINEC